MPTGMKIKKPRAKTEAFQMPNNANRAFISVLINYHERSHKDWNSNKEISSAAGTEKFPRLFDDQADSNMDSFRQFIYWSDLI